MKFCLKTPIYLKPQSRRLSKAGVARRAMPAFTGVPPKCWNVVQGFAVGADIGVY